MSEIDLNNMVPLEARKASEPVPSSSLLALGEGRCKNKRRDRITAKKKREPIVRTHKKEDGTEKVSKIFMKRDGEVGGLSYYTVTPEVHYAVRIKVRR